MRIQWVKGTTISTMISCGLVFMVISCRSENEIDNIHAVSTEKKINKIEFIKEMKKVFYPFSINSKLESVGLSTKGNTTGVYQNFNGDYYQDNLEDQYYSGINDHGTIVGFDGRGGGVAKEKSNFLMINQFEKFFLPFNPLEVNWNLIDAKDVNNHNNVIMSALSINDSPNSYYYSFLENKIHSIDIEHSKFRKAVDINNLNDVLVMTDSHVHLWNHSSVSESINIGNVIDVFSINDQKNFIGILNKNNKITPFLYDYANKKTTFLPIDPNINFKLIYLRKINNNNMIIGYGIEYGSDNVIPLFWNSLQEDISGLIKEELKKYNYILSDNPFMAMNEDNYLIFNVLDPFYEEKTIVMKL